MYWLMAVSSSARKALSTDMILSLPFMMSLLLSQRHYKELVPRFTSDKRTAPT